MRGPHILARTLGNAGAAVSIDPDRCAKQACWAVLFDMLSCSDALFRNAAANHLRLRIDEPIVGPVPDRIDLAVVLGDGPTPGKRLRSFATLAHEWDIALDSDDAALLARLPEIALEPPASPPAAVAVALTATACVASRADLPQLHARTVARGWLLKRHARYCVTAALTTIVDDDETSTQGVVDVLADALPRDPDAGIVGHDAVGATIAGAEASRWRRQLEINYLHHEQTVLRLCGAYRARNLV